jgi:hypothetical protein
MLSTQNYIWKRNESVERLETYETKLLLAMYSVNPSMNFTFTLPCIVIDFFLNNQTDELIIQIYPVIKLYTFRASFLPIIRNILLYIRHW